MSAFLESSVLVAIAETGDKTQLLSILLAAHYRRAWPIIAGILVATLINHAVTAFVGQALADVVTGNTLQLGVAVLFLLVGVWVLVPDAAPDGPPALRGSIFLTSLVAFFLAEIGDKTQLATLTLGAQHPETLQVILGTTAGMLVANVPAVLVGEALLRRVPLGVIRGVASVLFLAMGGLGLARYFGVWAS
jgi:putative Ca2+/H+ antiporter (TMEM165/GDT1 family)